MVLKEVSKKLLSGFPINLIWHITPIPIIRFKLWNPLFLLMQS